MNDIWSYVGGSVSALIGFACTQITNYYLVKSPRLALFAKGVSARTKKNDAGRVFKITDCVVDVRNFSKNDAYNISVIEVHFEDASIKLYDPKIVTSIKPITDQQDGFIKFTSIQPFDGELDMHGNVLRYEGRQFIADAKIKCIYQNQLGRKYSKTLKAEFKWQDPTFFTF